MRPASVRAQSPTRPPAKPAPHKQVKLQIQVVSDLHLEFRSSLKTLNCIKPTARILALAGDICCCTDDAAFSTYKRFIEEILPLYDLIIHVPGNHEYYNSPDVKVGVTINEVDERVRKYFKETSNKLVYLNNNSISFLVGSERYRIIGSTLWTLIPEARYRQVMTQINDYRHVWGNLQKGRVSPHEIAARCVDSRRYLRATIGKAARSGERVVVITHHKPYFKKDYNPDTVDIAYENDLAAWFVPPIVLWGYGHTHVADKKRVNGMVVYSNPRGYPGQKTGWKDDDVVSV